MTDINSTIIRFPAGKSSGNTTSVASITPVQETIFFSRREFNSILNLYGKMVASGHWKDYAIDSTKDQAVFSVYQNVHDRPLYQIAKTPKRADKQGAFSLVSGQGKILKRGHEIEKLLQYFNKQLIKLIR